MIFTRCNEYIKKRNEHWWKKIHRIYEIKIFTSMALVGFESALSLWQRQVSNKKTKSIKSAVRFHAAQPGNLEGYGEFIKHLFPRDGEINFLRDRNNTISTRVYIWLKKKTAEKKNLSKEKLGGLHCKGSSRSCIHQTIFVPFAPWVWSKSGPWRLPNNIFSFSFSDIWQCEL